MSEPDAQWWIRERLTGHGSQDTAAAAPMFSLDIHRRLAAALEGCAGGPERVGPADLAGLVGHLLRREHELSAHAPHWQAVPTGSPWPTIEQWNHAGLETVADPRDDGLHVRPLPFRPTWLEGLEPAAGVYGADGDDGRRRHDADAASADPMFAEVMDSGTYRGAGQREAVRAIFSAPPGATVTVSLPTGTGKSAVALAPAIQWARPQGVTLVVVPTIALAIDQERAARNILRRLGGEVPARLAYYGDQSHEEKQAVRERIRDGAQTLVFAGPESVVGGLLPALYEAATRGFLNLFVIDEAHMVSDWGVEFRPEFQSLAGIRTDLLRRAQSAGHDPFRTLLMSATLGHDALVTLRSLFGRPGPFHTVASSLLRPEPSYWMARCESDEQRLERFMEIVGKLPRPAIVYTTRKRDATTLLAALMESGYRRVKTFTGATPDAERRRVIHDFCGVDETGATINPGTDIVVATSAFGLGIDNDHVRTVVHLCIPERIDRYYQEVGRAGRDGRACMSLLMHTAADIPVARRLAFRRTLTPEIALDRWRAMMVRAEPASESGLVRLPLAARRSDVAAASSENHAWNERALSLLARAGLIEFAHEPPPHRDPDENDAAWEHRRRGAYDKYFSSRLIRQVGDVEGALLDGRAEEVRQITRQGDQRALDLMFEALGSNYDDIADLFSEAYQVPADRAMPPAWPAIGPQPSCGGCPGCRDAGRRPYEGVAPVPAPMQLSVPILSGALARWLPDPTRSSLTVLYERPHDQRTRRKLDRSLDDLLDRCVRHGVRLLCASPDFLARPAVRSAHQQAANRYLLTETLADGAPVFQWPAVPALFILPPDAPTRSALASLFTPVRSAARITVVCADTHDPERPTSTVGATRQPSVSLQTILGAL